MNKFASPKRELSFDRSSGVDANRSFRPSVRTTGPTKRREDSTMWCAAHTLEGELTQTISPAPRVSGDESRGKRSLGSRMVKI